jgi:anti-sigma B factor antagonist
MRAVSIAMGTDGALEVVLHGEIDFTNARQIGEAIQAAVVRERPSVIRVEMAEVTFLDSSGIGVLVGGMRAAEEVHAGYRVQHPNPRVFDQLRMAGLAEVFGLAEPAPEA